jgi:cytochrome P450
MSMVEADDRSGSLGPLVPPIPPRLPSNTGFFKRVAAMRESVISAWGQRAYEEEIIQGRFLARSSFILNTPVAMRYVLIDNNSNYTRTPGTFRVLRPLLGGAGPRVCVGANFALIAATLALAKVIGSFQVALLDKKPVIPLGVITTQADHSPKFALTPR